MFVRVLEAGSLGRVWIGVSTGRLVVVGGGVDEFAAGAAARPGQPTGRPPVTSFAALTLAKCGYRDLRRPAPACGSTYRFNVSRLMRSRRPLAERLGQEPTQIRGPHPVLRSIAIDRSDRHSLPSPLPCPSARRTTPATIRAAPHQMQPRRAPATLVAGTENDTDLCALRSGRRANTMAPIPIVVEINRAAKVAQPLTVVSDAAMDCGPFLRQHGLRRRRRATVTRPKVFFVDVFHYHHCEPQRDTQRVEGG